MRKLVKTQKLKEIEGREFNGEESPYWEGVAAAGGHENPLANPDVLSGAAAEQAATPSTPQLLMGEAVAHLQGRQREVYLLTMREGKSLADAGKVLGLTKRSAQEYRARAIKFIAAYCKAAIDRGRV